MEHIQLGDGINLYLYETSQFKTITTKVFVQEELSKDKVSASALIPMILRRGTKSTPTTLELARKMEELYGSAIDADIIKIGEKQIIEFYFDMVSPKLLPNGEQILAEGLRTFGELILDPVREGQGFNQQYFAQEQFNLKNLVEGLINEKRSYAYQRALQHMCKDEPHGIYKYGDTQQIKELVNEEVFEHYQQLIRSNPVDIFIVGEGISQIPELIKEWSWHRSNLRQLRPAIVKDAGQVQEVFETRDVQQGILVMGYRANQNYLDPNYYSLVVANAILGVFPHSKLFINVRERASLAYYVGSSLDGSKGIITISAGIDPSQYDKAVEIINAQIGEMQAGKITQDELERTKIGLISGMQTMADNPASIIDRNVIGVVHGQLRSLEEVIGEIEKVTLEQVQAAANQIKLDTVYFLSGMRGDL